MNGKMRKKAGLLSRVSTLAIIAAAGSFGVAQQAQAACDTTIIIPATVGNVTIDETDAPPPPPVTCVDVDGTVTGNVIVDDAIIGDPGAGNIPFFVGADITGSLINGGNIVGGFFTGKGAQAGALTISDGATVGTVVNNDQITSTSGNGIQLGGGENAGFISNGIDNFGDISSGTRYGIAALRGSLEGGLFNDAEAVIDGGLAAIYIDDSFQSWAGGIENHGEITAPGNGIQMGDGGSGNFDFSGGITNGFGATISGGNAGILITDDVDDFNDGISNDGLIEGSSVAISINALDFNGGVTNTGSILALGESGFSGDALFAGKNWNGTLDNSGLIQGGSNGFVYQGQSYNGDFINSGSIIGGSGAGVRFDNPNLFIEGETEGDPAQFTNTNLIQGGQFGFVIIAGGEGGDVNADFANVFAGGEGPQPIPTIEVVGEGSSGAAVLLAATNWTGNVTNEGVIRGGSFGMLLGATASEGITTIAENWQGDIANSGTIEGDEIGLALFADEFGDSETPNTLTNDLGGVISGGTTGLLVSVDTFNGSFVNDGSISGLTGALIFAETFNGTITNNGQITGFDVATALHITAGAYFGDIVNNGTLDAPGDALHLEIDFFDGTAINTGLIEATVFGNNAVTFDVGSDATFVNTDGGLIVGDFEMIDDSIFGGKVHTFIGEGDPLDLDIIDLNTISGLEGSITGDGNEGGNDDLIVVRNGAHFFIERQLEDEYGPLVSGTASNFASFTVEDGGIALMGSTQVGATDGTGYSFDNVDALNVTDGTLYIDNHTILGDGDGGLGTFTQGKNGRTMFFLLAPDGDDAPEVGVHYGQINADGLVDLQGGTISAFLDETTFAETSLTEITYEDVITGSSVSGDFTSTELFSVDSIWQLAYEINGPGTTAGSSTVDLLVTRTDLSHLGNIGGLVIETAGPWKGMVNDRANGMAGGACGGIAGPGWCSNRFAQADIGAGQVMTDATPGADPFSWLRTGVRRVGETAAWGRGVGVWGETDGDIGILASDFDLYGGIVGVDHVFTPVLLAGVAAQYTTQDISFDGVPDNANIDSFEVGAYVSYGDARLYLNANTSVIFHDFEVTRFVGAGQAFGDYDGTTVSAYVEAGKVFETDGPLRIQPLLALSFAHLETDAYTETGTALTLLNVFDTEFDTLKGMAGARFAYPMEMDRNSRFIPEVRFIYAHEFLDDQSSFVASSGGPPIVVFGEEISRETFIVGGGFTAAISEATSLVLDYDAGLNEDFTTHTVSAGFRTRW